MLNTCAYYLLTLNWSILCWDLFSRVIWRKWERRIPHFLSKMWKSYLWILRRYMSLTSKLTLEVPVVTKINFLLTISIQCQEIRFWELIKWSPKRKCFDLFSNSLNLFFKEMYRDQFGEFASGYSGLKGLKAELLGWWCLPWSQTSPKF